MSSELVEEVGEFPIAIVTLCDGHAHDCHIPTGLLTTAMPLAEARLFLYV